MSSHLVDGLATTDALAAVFSDESVLQAMLDVESALARVQAMLGIIPGSAAAAIVKAARASEFDATAIARAARASATPIVPLVAALRERVASVDGDCASSVHYGVTSQDISDTALVMLLTRAVPIIGGTQMRIARRLRAMSDEHADTVMTGRTLLQPATPITFGLKVATWYAGIHRAWRQLEEAIAAAAVVQCGGPAGTLAALADKGKPVRWALADALALHDGPPWHTERGRLAVVACGCGILTGALGKMARDVSLLMQHEVGEVAEPGGGSSSMPHKRNPAGSVRALAAATRTPGLVAAYLAGMVQEHERAAGGWQAEWPTLAALIQTTGAASEAMADVTEGLTVDRERMRKNLDRVVESKFISPSVADALRRDLLACGERTSEDTRVEPDTL
jgi:3-carboxy-cis,cis-muconate cycloisomerase